MGYFIITDSNWARLRDGILALAEDLPQGFRRTEQAYRLAAQR